MGSGPIVFKDGAGKVLATGKLVASSLELQQAIHAADIRFESVGIDAARAGRADAPAVATGMADPAAEELGGRPKRVGVR